VRISGQSTGGYGSLAKNTSTGAKNDWTITGLRHAGGDHRQPPV